MRVSGSNRVALSRLLASRGMAVLEVRSEGDLLRRRTVTSLR